MRKVLEALLLALLCTGAARAADVSLMPVNVKLDRQNDRATVQVTNNGSEAVVMQADAIAWNRVDGKDLDGPTTDIIVNPPIFTVQPGQTQVVRVGLRRSQELAQEATYRMVLREVPTQRLADIGNVSGSVRVLVALRVPVYVAPAKVLRAENWQVERLPNGDVVAKVSNTGNVHLKIGELRLEAAAEANGLQGKTLALQGSNAVIFPGEERSFRLQGGNAKASHVAVLTEQGVQQLALNTR